MKLRLWMVVTVMLVTMSAARAQEPVGGTPTPPPPPPSGGGEASGADLYGAVGQIALTQEIAASFAHVSSSMGDATSTSITLAPALDYFVAPNISIGGAVAFTHNSFDSGIPNAPTSDSTGFGLLARVGYNARLGAMVSIWPRLAIGYAHTSSGSGNTSSSGWNLPLRIDAPLLVHVAPHFFVGIGPVFQTQLVSKIQGNDASKITIFGLTSIVGGYFGGV